MTIEQKALELVNAAVVQKGGRPYSLPPMRNDSVFGCLCRALEAHELDKSRHAAELREQAERFSEACETWLAKWKHGTPSRDDFKSHFWPYLPAPVDPLAEVVREAFSQNIDMGDHEISANLRAAAERLGYTFAIVKKEAVNG